MKKLQIFLLSIICFLIPGCTNNSIDYYANKKNKVDLRSFFDGDIDGWGAIFDYQGRQTRSFYVKIKGTWNQNQGTLDEWFEFDDGEKTERTWQISFSNDKIFTATAKDVIGSAHGEQNGNAVNIRYVLQIPYNGSTINLSMDDWMYHVEKDIILNRTSMKKFGIKLGEIVIFMKNKR